jgi:AcrR family transcriptional regulator
VTLIATRTYSQTRRAEATERSRRAILVAAQELFRDQGRFELPLEEVAARAGCSTRSVLRHFGSKQGLMAAAIADAEVEVMASRAAPPGDVAAALRALVGHYEELGDRVVGWLALADRYPLVRQVTESGARLHREWVETVFAADLAGLERGERRIRLALLVTVTDVYVWELLRRRQGLGRAATEAAMLGLVDHARGAGA